MSRSRDYCFTWFGEEPPSFGGTCVYLIAGQETCPKTGRKHWQSYAEFKNAVSIHAAQKALNAPKCHMEKRRGSPSQAADYCKKDGDFKEFGERRPDPQPGKRNDIIALRDAAKDARTTGQLIDCDEVVGAYARYGRMAREIIERENKKRTREFRVLEVTVHWGETGTGKTREPYEMGAFKWEPTSPEWWDGYEGEDILLIDEFYGQLKPARLLTILDGYQLRLPIKGGFTYANWTKVYITSNKDPREWYSEDVPEEVKAALMRRITRIKHFNKSLC